jgi:4-hydroxy-tetrahydrodipicolinate synthase
MTRYRRTDAKDFARANMRGIWAAALTPFLPDGAIDEQGFRRNLRHWIGELGIDGVFVAGKQGEFFSLSVPERKRLFEIAAEECAGKAGTVMSCSDQNLDVVIELARHAEAVGADSIVVHAPVLHSTARTRSSRPITSMSRRRPNSGSRSGAIPTAAT